jgi:hypothetical protein
VLTDVDVARLRSRHLLGSGFGVPGSGF